MSTCVDQRLAPSEPARCRATIHCPRAQYGPTRRPTPAASGASLCNARAAPERVHHVERLVLAVLHRARGDVLDRRLVSADEHDVRHEHRRREHAKQTRSACAPRY